MNTAPTRSNAPYGWTLLGMTVLLWFLPLVMPLPNSGWEWKILLISITLSCLSFGLYMILPPATQVEKSMTYMRYFGLICAIVAITTLAAIPVLEVLRVLRFMD